MEIYFLIKKNFNEENNYYSIPLCFSLEEEYTSSGSLVSAFEGRWSNYHTEQLFLTAGKPLRQFIFAVLFTYGNNTPEHSMWAKESKHTPICKLLIRLFYHKNRLVISSQEFWYNKTKSNFIRDEQKIIALAETWTSMPRPIKWMGVFLHI